MRLRMRLLGCLGGLVMCAALALIALPGSAFASECITGSGSSLQAEQQSLWTGTDTNAFKPFKCGTDEAVLYTATGSGKGLLEFGFTNKKLEPAESGNKAKLDGYIGTDDPPTHTEILNAAGASGSTPWTVPTEDAPVDIIIHPPVACDVLGGDKVFPILNTTLADLWSLHLVTWGSFLLAVQKHLEELKTGLAFKFTITSACHERDVLREVRSDSSGTSFAFKQYLCQIEPTTWGNVTNASECQSGHLYVTDKPEWPGLVDKAHGSGPTNNEGSKEEAKAVAETEGSVGYVNAANAVSAGFKGYEPGILLFWSTVQNTEEPIKGKEGNCPKTFNFESKTSELEAEKGEWEKVHLAKPSQTEAYPLCTFTYDIGWENYNTSTLLTEYGSKAPEVGTTAMEYFLYMTGTGATEGQNTSQIHEYYSPLPTAAVQPIAHKIAKEKIG